MTAIVGVTEGRRVWFGADSATTGVDGSLEISREPKVWRTGNILVGVAGSAATDTDLRVNVQFPAPPRAAADLDEWAFRGVRRALGQLGVDDPDEGISVMIGVAGRIYLYDVEKRIYCRRSPSSYAAIGSGGEIAGAVLRVLCNDKPRARLTRALEAAEAGRGDVRRPWRWASL